MIFVISGALLIQMLGEGEMSAMSMPNIEYCRSGSAAARKRNHCYHPQLPRRQRRYLPFCKHANMRCKIAKNRNFSDSQVSNTSFSTGIAVAINSNINKTSATQADAGKESVASCAQRTNRSRATDLRHGLASDKRHSTSSPRERRLCRSQGPYRGAHLAIAPPAPCSLENYPPVLEIRGSLGRVGFASGRCRS